MNSKTKITSFRVSYEQLKQLKMLPSNISASVVVRALLREYLEGRLPQMHAKVIEEALRTEYNMHETQF